MARSAERLVVGGLAATAPATVATDQPDCTCRLDGCASAARRTCRISSSYAAISENDGHAAITRPVIVG